MQRSRAGRHDRAYLALLCIAPLLTACASGNPARRGAAPSAEAGRYGLLLMAHGGSPEWNAAVREAVAPVERELPTALAFGMADPESLQAAVSSLESRGVDRIAVVRLFISGTSFYERTIAALSGLEPEIVVSKAGLVESSIAGEIVRDRVKALSRSPRDESVLILAHGVGEELENRELLDDMREIAGAVRGLGAFREVRVATLREDWPEKRARAERDIRRWLETRSRTGTVIVVPLRLYGFGPYESVLEGLAYRADGTGLLPHPLISDWILETAAGTLCRSGWEAALVGCGPAE